MAETRSSACPPVSSIGCNVTPGSAIFIYHGCSIQTFFTVTKCPSSITISNLVWTKIPGTCNVLENEINLAFAGPNGQVAVDLIYDAIWSSMGNQAQTFVLNAEAQKLNSIYKCSNLTVIPYTINYVVSGCYSLCSQFVDSGEGGGQWNLAESVCGQSCCKRSTPFCINENKTISYGLVTRESTGGCEPVSFNCPSGFNPPSNSTSCRPACNRT